MVITTSFTEEEPENFETTNRIPTTEEGMRDRYNLLLQNAVYWRNQTVRLMREKSDRNKAILLLKYQTDILKDNLSRWITLGNELQRRVNELEIKKMQSKMRPAPGFSHGNTKSKENPFNANAELFGSRERFGHTGEMKKDHMEEGLFQATTESKQRPFEQSLNAYCDFLGSEEKFGMTADSNVVSSQESMGSIERYAEAGFRKRVFELEYKGRSSQDAKGGVDSREEKVIVTKKWEEKIREIEELWQVKVRDTRKECEERVKETVKECEVKVGELESELEDKEGEIADIRREMEEIKREKCGIEEENKGLVEENKEKDWLIDCLSDKVSSSNRIIEEVEKENKKMKKAGLFAVLSLAAILSVGASIAFAFRR